jgi:WD40 repeat protein
MALAEILSAAAASASTPTIASATAYHKFTLNAAVTSCHFDPNNPHRVLATTRDGDITVYNIRRKSAHLSLVGGHVPGTCIAHAAFCPTSSAIVSSSQDDDTICLWDGHTGALKATISTAFASDVVTHVPPSSRSPSTVVTVTSKSTSKSTSTPPPTPAPHACSLITPDGISIVTLSQSGALVLDPTQDTPPQIVKCSGTAADFSPDGRNVFTGSSAGHLRVFSTITGTEGVDFSGGTFDRQGHTADISSLEVSPGGNYLATGGLDGLAFVWDTTTGDLLTKLDPPPIAASCAFASTSASITSSRYVTWKDASTLILSSSSEPDVHIFQIDSSTHSGQQIVTTATLLHSILGTTTGHTFGEISYNRTTEHLAAASTAGETVVFSLKTLTDTPTSRILSHPYPNDSADTSSVAWSPDGAFLALSSISSNVIKIYKSSNNFNLAHTIESPKSSTEESGIVDIAFSRCGDFFACVGLDRICVIHDFKFITRPHAPHKSEGKPLMVVTDPLLGAISCCRFNPAVDEIFTGGSATTHTKSKLVPIGSVKHLVHSSIVRDVFFEDVAAEKRATGGGRFDWRAKSLIGRHIENSNSRILCRTNRLGRNLIHTAAKNNVAGFLEVFLDPSTLSFDPLEGSLVIEMSSAAAACSACLMVDHQGRNPLSYALEAENALAIDAILKCILLAFDTRLSNHSLQRAQQQHLGDLFPLPDFLRTLIEYPSIGLKFLCKVAAVPNYRHIVMKDCESFNVQSGMSFISGSHDRTPDSFWVHYFFPAEIEENAATDDDSRLSSGGKRAIIMKRLNRTLSNAADGSLASFQEEIEDNAFDTSKYALPVKASVVPIAHAAGWVKVKDPKTNFVYNTTLLKEVVVAVSKTKNYDVFDKTDFMTEIIDFKWRSHVRIRFLRSLVLDALMVLFYTIDGLVHTAEWREHVAWKAANDAMTTGGSDMNMTDMGDMGDIGDMAGSEDTPGETHSNHGINKELNTWTSFWQFVPTVFTLVLWAYFLNHERRQVVEKFRLKSLKWKTLLSWRYFPPILVFRHATSEVWNAIDVLSLQLIIFTYIVRLVEYYGSADSFGASSVTIAFGLPVLYINLLKYLQGFQSSGELVSMVVAIIRGIMVFSLMLFTILMGFSLGFFALFQAGTRTVDGVCGEDGVFLQTDVASSLLNGFTLLLGDFDMEEYTASYSYVASCILFVFFMFLVNVVMLNLLIAIMGDIFDSVQQNAKAQHIFSKASLILEHESIMRKSQKQSQELFPKFLQIMKPVADEGSIDDEENNWTGRLKSIKNYIRKGLHAQSEANRQIQEKRDADGLVMEKKIRGIEADVLALSADVHEIKSMLKELLKRS